VRASVVFSVSLLLLSKLSIAQGGDAVLSASVSIDADHVLRTIPPTLYGSNLEWVWNGYSLWNQASSQPDTTLVNLARSMGTTLLRYPGGMYADFYHWRDGIGAYSSRPTVSFRPGDAAGQIIFGTDEALQFADESHGQLMITVNAGTGTASEAADWVRYVNADKLRVQYWEIGNELYINDGSVAQNAITTDPQTYAARVVEFAEAMRAADPRIKIGAIGGQNQGAYSLLAYPNWDQIVLQKAGSQIDFLAVHNAYAPVNVSDNDDLRSVYAAMLAAPSLIARNLQTVSDQILTFAPSFASKIRIAVTEWGPFFQSSPSGRYAQHTRTLGAALFAADTLKTFFESPATQIANFHVLNDLSIMCWICSQNGSYPPVWTETPESMVFELIRNHFGTQVVSSTVSAPSYTSPAIGTVASVAEVPYLDLVSTLSADGTTLYALAINKSLDSSVRTSLTLHQFAPAGAGLSWTLNGAGIDSNTGTMPLQVPGAYWAPQAEDPANPEFSKGSPGKVTVTQASFLAADVFTYTFPAHSVTVLQLRSTNESPISTVGKN
jgi:alpha-N-arabinofuranosidase